MSRTSLALPYNVFDWLHRMPWRGPEHPGDFPTLGYDVAGWIQANCVVPDREDAGQLMRLTREQVQFLAFFYRINPDTGRFFYERGAQLIRPQKHGKGPFSAAVICAEAAPDGCVLFDGWDAHGEPVGKPWPAANIQVTAASEDQTDNVWRALVPMIRLGPLVNAFKDSGFTRIILPNGGWVEPVTASARSRLGQRITFAVQDETQSWFQSNNGWWLADNQRRNLAGTGGRFLETTNAFDPVEGSVAQRTYEAKAAGVYVDDVDGGAGSVRNKQERRRVLRKVYGDSLKDRGGWVDLDRIDTEIEALLEHDPAQAERFFLNRKLATSGAAFDFEQFRKLAKPHTVHRGETIVVGVDGARYEDSLAVVATHVQSGYQWPVVVIEKPEDAPDDYEHDFKAVDAAVKDLEPRYSVWRIYIDPQRIDWLVESWSNHFGEKRVVKWETYRPRPIAFAVRAYQQAIAGGNVSHDGSPVFLEHVRNARKRMLTVLDEKERPMFTLTKDHVRSPRKIDAAMAAILSWEARADCVEKGVVWMGDGPVPEPAPKPQSWVAGRALSMSAIEHHEPVGPLGSLS
jgi:hypothetical protein